MYNTTTNVDVRDQTIAAQSQRILELTETVRNLNAHIQQLHNQLHRTQAIGSPAVQTITSTSVPTPWAPQDISQEQTQPQPQPQNHQQQQPTVPVTTSNLSSVTPSTRGTSSRSPRRSGVSTRVRGIAKRRRTSENGEGRTDSPRAATRRCQTSSSAANSPVAVNEVDDSARIQAVERQLHSLSISPDQLTANTTTTTTTNNLPTSQNASTSRNRVLTTRDTADVLRRAELRTPIKRPRSRRNFDTENELLRRFMRHRKVCRYCVQLITGRLYKLRSTYRDLPGRKHCCSEPECLSIDRHLWAPVKCRWDTVPTAPLPEEVHGHARDPVMHLRKCLAQLGYTSGDATEDIWDVVYEFRVRHKLFGPRMRAYTKAVEVKLKMLVERARKRGWRASVDFSAGCDPVFTG